MSSEEKISMEDKMAQIDEIVKKLENSDTTLEEAFTEYSKGVKLVGECNAQIDKVEKKVKLLMGDGTTEDFD